MRVDVFQVTWHVEKYRRNYEVHWSGAEDQMTGLWASVRLLYPQIVEVVPSLGECRSFRPWCHLLVISLAKPLGIILVITEFSLVSELLLPDSFRPS